MTKVKPIPDGYHTLTPFLLTKDAAKVVDFLKRAFNAEVISVMKGDDGTIQHAEIRIGNSMLMLGEAKGEWQPMPTMLYLYVEDVDNVYKKAVAAGGKSLREPTNEFYGDRSSGVMDSSGNQWWIATHVEDVSPVEMEKRHKEVMAKS